MTTLSEKVVGYFQASKSKYLEMIKELVAIPSVSFSSFDQKEVEKCAFKVLEMVKSCGIENAELIYVEDNQRPYVYGEWLHAPRAPTLLLYAHYDVQPPGTPERWESPAFVATERNGRLYGRGAADDKGGLMVHLAAIQSWLEANGSLPVNIKLLIEGEEESGSDCLDQLLAKYKERLQADVIIIPDVENFDEDVPGLTVSLRGMVAVHLEIKALRQPLHSGMWGGAVPDAAAAMSKILSTLVDEQGNIAIPAIIEMSPKLSTQQEEELRHLPLDKIKLRKDIGLLENVSTLGEPEDFRQKIWFLPALTINGIQASSRQQASNIICDQAWAKVSIRTVAPMDKVAVFEALKEHIQRVCPFGLEVIVTEDGLGDWWTTTEEQPAMQAMIRSLKKAWGRAPVKMGCGGSIPFVKAFSDTLNGAPALLIGVEDPQSKAHSENESLSISGWEKSVASCIYLYEELVAAQTSDRT